MIQSVDRAVRILFELQDARRLGLTQLASRLELANSTCHGIVQTLVAQGLVEQDATGRYMLGPGVLRLGNVYLESNELRLRSLAAVDALAERTGHAVRVGVLLGTDVIVVHHVFRPDGSRQMSETGISIPVHASALGRALLAFHPEARALLPRDGPLPRLTGRTIVDVDELDERLEEVRANAIAYGQDEVVIGESEIAAPIVDADGGTVGAVGLVIPTPELTDDPLLVNAVRDAAVRICRSLGAPTWPVVPAGDAQRAG